MCLRSHGRFAAIPVNGACANTCSKGLRCDVQFLEHVNAPDRRSTDAADNKANATSEAYVICRFRLLPPTTRPERRANRSISTFSSIIDVGRVFVLNILN